MGDTASNVGALAHYSSGARQGYRVWVHLGQLHVMSGDSADSDFAAFRTAVLNDAPNNDLDDLGVEAWGSWYTTNVAGVSGARTQLRLAVAELVAP